MSTGNQEEPEQEGGGDGLVAYLPSILWQRRWWVIVPLLLCSAAGIAAALLIPPRYQSSATLLVESPQLPTELVGPAVATSLIDKRIAKVRQQVLSRPDLVELIENNNLYSAERQRRPLSEVLELMRESTAISPITADIANSGSGSNTIAFSLSFDYPDPQKAQLVAQDFVERLVELDATQTAEQAVGTVEFLSEQANGLATQIAAIEGQIQSIKAANGSALASAGMVMMPSGGGGYQTQIAQLQRDNAQLASQARQQTTAVERDPTVLAAEAQLAGAKATYSDDHPDVRLAERRLAEARRFAARNLATQNTSGAIQNQIAANNEAIAALSSVQNNELARANAVASAQSRGPVVVEQVAQLQAKADGLRANYQVISTNLINARGTAKLSEQQKGERLTVIDPPVVADRPIWPNQPLLVVGGIVGGGVLGLALVLLLELIMKPVRGVGALSRLTGAPPLVIVPKLAVRTPALAWFRRGRRAAPAGSGGRH